jgi:hypothetical protein
MIYSCLGELLELNYLNFGKSPESERLPLNDEVLIRLQKIIAHLGYYEGQIHGHLDESTRIALNAFLGNENFEERCDTNAGWMDQPVFEYIVKKYRM